MVVTAARRAFLLLLVLASVAVACGNDDGEDTGGAPPGSSSPSGRVLTVEEALAAGEAGGDAEPVEPVEVRGALFVEGSVVRLCDAIMESYPPQCGGATLLVVGLDVDSVPLQSSDDGRVRWAEGVELRGVVEGDELQV